MIDMTTPEVDWSQWYSSDCCPALMGEPCYLLSSGGPEALPPIFATRPHATRRRKDQAPPPGAEPPERVPAPAKPRTQTKRTAVARRSASRTQSTVGAWQKLAAGQKKGNRS